MLRVTINGYVIEGTVEDMRELLNLKDVSPPTVVPTAPTAVELPVRRKRKKPYRDTNGGPTLQFRDLENTQFWVDLFKEHSVSPPSKKTFVRESHCNIHGATLRYGENPGGSCILCVRLRYDKREKATVVSESE